MPSLADLLALPHLAAQKAFLDEYVPQMPIAQRDALALALKQEADRRLRADARASLEVAALLYHFASLTNNLQHRALGLFAEANALSIGGLGEHARAVDLCDEAATLFHALGRPADEADAQTTKIYALSILGRHKEALAAGEWASQVLEANHEWLRLATLLTNVAILHGRMGRDAEALSHFERAGALYERSGDDGRESLPGVAMNRALVLRNLARFDESLAANQQAITLLTALGQHAEVGHAQQTLAFTLFVLGRYSEALRLLHDTRDLFLGYARLDDVLITELYLADCLLHLRRFGEALALCAQIRTRSASSGRDFEGGRATLISAVAHAELRQNERALDALEEAQRLFAQSGNAVWAAQTEIEAAALLLRDGRAVEALESAKRSRQLFAARELPTRLANAQLVCAQAHLALQQPEAAQPLIHAALATGQQHDLPHLIQRAQHLLGWLAEQAGDEQTALARYAQAVAELERQQDWLMTEFRADFVADKQQLYEDIVRLYLRRDEPDQAFAYVERSRSAALRQLVAQRVDLRIRPRSRADQPLVDELVALRRTRDQLVRRWGEADAAFGNGDRTPTPLPEEVRALEGQIASCWHRLLVRNADYARDATLGQTADEPLYARLGADTLLLEYYFLGEQLHLFLITQEQITCHLLTAQPRQIVRLSDLLRRNLRMVVASEAAQVDALTQNAQQILHRLYNLLLAPVADVLRDCSHLVIVPHGALHYLPFHAFVADPADARSYLLDSHEIRYLPAASFLSTDLREVPRRKIANEIECGQLPAVSTLAFGHAYHDLLPHAEHEAQSVARIMNGRSFTGSNATSERLRQAAVDARVLHLATHGDFRADNPLFSGLALADGWLTTLDIFDLRLSASLVTLSACQTGRSVIGGGDELLGLLRAFLAAGAQSLVLSQWAVEDRSTARLMEHFYTELMQGASKSAALRAAQQTLRAADSSPYNHPYFWASFFLVGDVGTL